jgi:hypothetical protein
MLLKTNVEKMSVYGLAIMLMKTSKLNRACHYVNEKKGSCWRWLKRHVASLTRQGAHLACPSLRAVCSFA